MNFLTNLSQHWQKRNIVVWMCFFALFVCYLDRVNIAIAILPMQQEFNWTETTKGLILASFFIGYIFMQIGGGLLSNKYGGKIVLAVAVVWWSVFTLLTPAFAYMSIPALILCRILMGVGEGASTPAAVSMLKVWVPTKERSRAMSLLSSGAPVGTLIALLSSGWIIENFGWPAIFYIFGFTGFIWLIFWQKLVFSSPYHHPKISSEEKQLFEDDEHYADHSIKTPFPWKKVLSHKAAWALIVAGFATNWNLFVFISWLPSYFANAHNLSLTQSGIYSAAPWLTLIFTLNFAGRWADNLIKSGKSIIFTRKLAQSIGLIGCATSLFLVQFATSVETATLAICSAVGMLAFCYSGFAANCLDVSSKHAETMWGIVNTVGTIPGIIGVAITGWLVDISGNYNSAFLLASSLAIIATLFWLYAAEAEPIFD